MKLSRAEVTERLTCAFSSYMRQKVYSTFHEIGVRRGGSLRADVVALSMKREIVIGEVKSCWADYSTDKKWPNYIPYCNKFYFVITEELWESHGEQIKMDARPYGAGIIAVNITAYWDGNNLKSRMDSIRVVANARKKDVDEEYTMWLITKMAWRGGYHKPRRSRRRKKRR